MAARVEIYTSPFCGYCARAKSLLSRKGVDFIEYDVLSDSSKRDEMMARSDGRSTVPQIFIDDVGIGGCDELHGLDSEGRLDPMLTGGAR